MGLAPTLCKKQLATKTHTREKAGTSVLGEDGVSKNGSCMMPDIESQTFLEAARQTTIISPKTTTTMRHGISVESEMREIVYHGDGWNDYPKI
jgi:hypothetical protein